MDDAGVDDAAKDHATAGGTASQIAALFTPIPNGRVLAALCGLNKVNARVLETSGGTLAVLADASEEALDHAAAAISTFAQQSPLLAMERRAGQITIHTYTAGERGTSLPPGLALNDAPGVVTTLMSGAQTIDDLAASHPDKVHGAPRGRLRSFWALRTLARAAKKQ